MGGSLCAVVSRIAQRKALAGATRWLLTRRPAKGPGEWRRAAIGSGAIVKRDAGYAGVNPRRQLRGIRKFVYLWQAAAIACRGCHRMAAVEVIAPGLVEHGNSGIETDARHAGNIAVLRQAALAEAVDSTGNKQMIDRRCTDRQLERWHLAPDLGEVEDLAGGAAHLAGPDPVTSSRSAAGAAARTGRRGQQPGGQLVHIINQHFQRHPAEAVQAVLGWAAVHSTTCSQRLPLVLHSSQ